MKLSDAYLDILKRAGDGYSDYLDRARELFWRSLGAIIMRGEFTGQEVTGISMHHETRVRLSEFPHTLNAYNETYHVFNYYLTIDGDPGIVFTSVTTDMFLKASKLLNLSQMSGLKEVLWTSEFPTIKIAYDLNDTTIDTSYANVHALVYGVGHNDITSANDNALSESYIAYSLLIRAIEGAVNAIKQELRG